MNFESVAGVSQLQVAAGKAGSQILAGSFSLSYWQQLLEQLGLSIAD